MRSFLFYTYQNRDKEKIWKVALENLFLRFLNDNYEQRKKEKKTERRIKRERNEDIESQRTSGE